MPAISCSRAPGIIAAATYSGHAFARGLGQMAAGFDAFR